MPKGRKHIHTAKFRRCVKEVSKKSKGKYNPYAVCEASMGYEESMVPLHMRSRKEQLDVESQYYPEKIKGMPAIAVLKMVRSRKTPKALKAYWKNQLKRVI
jgi:hypothetical protein